jgi:hypothetical protein
VAVSLRSLRVTADFDPSGYVRGASQKSGADEKMVASGNQLTGSLQQTDRRLGESSTALERFKAKTIEGYRETAAFQKAQADLNRFMGTGKLTVDEYEKSLAGIHRRYGQLQPALNDNNRLMVQNIASAGQMRASLVNLGQQAQDVFVTLAAGQNPLQILIQQGTQIATIFAATPGGVSGVLGAAGRAIAGLVTPTAAATVGAAALAVGFGVLVARAIEAEGAVRRFDVQLRGLGRSGEATGEDMLLAARRLRDVGLAQAEAEQALRTARRQGLTSAGAERVVRTGQNLIPVLGEGAPEQFMSAVASRSVDSLGRMAQQLGVVSAAEIVAAREAARFGNEIRILDEWVTRIEQRTKGLNDEALSPLGRQLRDVRNNVSDLLDTMARNSVIQDTVMLINNMVSGLKFLFELQPPEWFNRLMMMGGQGQATNFWGFPMGPQREFTAPIPPRASAGTLDTGNPMNWPRTYNVPPEFAGLPPPRPSEWMGDAITPGLRNVPGFNAEAAQQNIAAMRQFREELGAVGTAATGTAEAVTEATTATSVYADTTRESSAVLTEQEIAFKKLTAAADLAIRGDREIAKGYLESAAAGQKAEAQAQALSETLGRLGNTQSELARRQTEERALQLQVAQGYRQIREFAQQSATDRSTIESLELQARLQGQSTEEITKQVALLQVRQQAEAAGLPVTDRDVQARLRVVDALSQANTQLVEMQRQQQRTDDLFRSIGDTISRTIGDAISSIFDPSKPVKWGESLRNIVTSIGNQIMQSMVIRPITGQPLGLVTYGEFGELGNQR